MTDSDPDAPITLRAAAQAVAAAPPPLDEWQRGRGRVVPQHSWIRHIRTAGWPVASVEVELPRQGHTSGGGPGTVRQPVTVVPESWLRAMATILSREWSTACRFVIPDAGRPRGRPAKNSPSGTLPPGTKQYNVRVTDSEREAIEALLRRLRGGAEADENA